MNSHIFAAQTRQGTMRIYELAATGDFKLAEMEAIFAELLPQAEHFLPHLRRVAAGQEQEWLHKRPHQWLVTIDEAPAGLLAFTYSERHNVGLGHHLAIRPRQGQFSFGAFTQLREILIYLARQQLVSDASHAGQMAPAGLLFATDNPPAPSRNGYPGDQFQDDSAIYLPVLFHEPPALLRADQSSLAAEWSRGEFSRHELAILPQRPAEELLTDGSIRNLVNAILCDHYGLPTDHWAVTEALASITLPVPEPVHAARDLLFG